MANLKITLHHGLVNRTPKQRATAQSLGLRKIGQSVIREDKLRYPRHDSHGSSPRYR